MHKMEKITPKQAVATEPEDRQVSCVCTYYILMRRKAEVSHLTLLRMLLLPLGGPATKEAGLLLHQDSSAGSALPGPDR